MGNGSLKVLILCGGLGSRLKTLNSDRPKFLAPIAGLPFAAYFLQFLQSEGLKQEDIILLVGHQSKMIEAEFCESLLYSKEQVPLGTGGAIKKAIESYPAEYYLVCNGDTFFHFPLRDFVKEGLKSLEVLPELQLVMALRFLTERESHQHLGNVQLDENAHMIYFGQSHKCHFMNAGFYILKREMVEGMEEKFSLEVDRFPQLVQQKKIIGRVFNGEFLDIGTPDDFHLAQTLVPKFWKEGLS